MDSSSTRSLELILHLQSFEGPLDLLLHMIRQRDVDIFDIPIYQIADEFQHYVDWFQVLDLDRAGEYLLMAAELAHIKSRMLLPREPDKLGEDPRKELVDRLVAYEQVQTAAKYLRDRHHLGHDVFKRGSDPAADLPPPPLPPNQLEIPGLLDLFKKMLKRRLRHSAGHSVRREKISVHQRIAWLYEQFRNNRCLRFSSLLSSIQGRPMIIATFLAILELCRLRRLYLRQIAETDIEMEAIGDLDDINYNNIEMLSINEPTE
jgi:segregation and condensation protein A